MEVSRTIISNIILILALIAGGNASAQTASPTPAAGGMTLVGSPSGVSAFEPATTTSNGTTNTTTDAKIYGGYTGLTAGSECVTNPTSGQTCNSCDGTGLKICNQTSVYPGLYLTMTIKTGTTIPSGARLRWKYSDVTGSYAVDNPTQPTLAANTDILVQIKWSSLCNAANTSDGGNCVNSFAKTLHVGIDNGADDTIDDKVIFNIVFRYLDPATADQTSIPTVCDGTTAATTTTQGICDYSITRGDEKVYISTYEASGNDLLTPDATVKFNRLIMFYNVDDTGAIPSPAAITNISDSKIINLQNNSPNQPSIADPRIRDLKNESYYCFVLANMDETGIISYYPNATTLGNTGKICAQPSKVVGLLDDKSCFITTATYGSPMAPEVQTFREFRNQYLLTSSIGISFVKFYYKFGPEAAEWISHSQALKSLSLLGLWPILMFVKLSLLIGLLPATLIALLGTVLLYLLVQQILRNRSSLKGEA